MYTVMEYFRTYIDRAARLRHRACPGPIDDLCPASKTPSNRLMQCTKAVHPTLAGRYKPYDCDCLLVYSQTRSDRRDKFWESMVLCGAPLTLR